MNRNKFLIAIILLCPCLGYSRVYVDCDVQNSGDGLSWATAFKTIKEASGENEIWVKEGSYNNEAGELTITIKGMVYGGFRGDELNREERNPVLNPTIFNIGNGSFNFKDSVDGFCFDHRVDQNSRFAVYGRLQKCVINGTVQFRTFTEWGLPSADSCIFLGSEIGAYTTDFSTLTIKNSLFCGNSEYGFLAAGGSDAVLENCTFADGGLSTEPYEWYWNGFFYYTGSEVTVRNSIFNGDARIVEGFNCEVYPINCLFWGNYDADEINAGFNGARDNISGDPLFRHGVVGAWSQAPVYDPARCRTRLVNSATTFTPGRLRGEILNPDTTQKLNAYILDNGENWIEVLGDVTTYAAQGEPYQVLNYRLPSGSAALDAGTLEGAPKTDKEDYSRPYDIPLQGREGENTVDIGCYEAHPARRPRDGDVIPTNATYNVRWDKTYFPDSKIRIEMWREGQYLKTVRVRTDNDGVLEWRPGDEPLPAQLDNLQLRLCSRNELAIIHTSGIFSIRRATGTGKVWLEYE